MWYEDVPHDRNPERDEWQAAALWQFLCFCVSAFERPTSARWEPSKPNFRSYGLERTSALSRDSKEARNLEEQNQTCKQSKGALWISTKAYIIIMNMWINAILIEDVEPRRMQKLCQLWLVWHKQGRDEPMLTLSLELSPPSIVAIDVAASEACILAGSSSQSDNVKNRLYDYDRRLQVVLVPFSLFCIASWDDFVLHLCVALL